MTRRWQRAVLTVSALLPLGVASAFAGPNGASVVSGGATVQGQGTANVVVNQSTQSAIINWQTFNIGSGETTRIYMPNSSSTQLDRVTGGQGPSQILGTLSSNGKVFLVNPDGILFGMGARINVGSLVATTNDIRNEDFVAGRYNFSIPGNPNASIVNLGTITAQTGGFAALVAPGVRNTGTIIAKLGTIALASGNAFTLDMYGDNLITLGVTDKVASQVIDVATGKPLKSLVNNEGTLKANGGTVVLTAVGARKIVDSVINTSGVIEADTIGTHNGKIVLGGPTETSKYAHAQKPTITVSGTLSAAGKRNGTTGGSIQITGRNIQVAGATINTSGQAGGGTVLIGGDWGGSHPNTSLAAGDASASLQPYAVPNANTVSIDAATMIDASATGTGNGGKVIVWANQATTFLGTILAKGGAQSGNGGFVETSGGTLTYNGAVNTSALNGKTGTWLLDPTDLTIDSTGASTISRGLASNNVVVYTDANGNTSGQGTTSSGLGDIIVASAISWSSGNTLTLNANNAITVNAPITIMGAGGLVLDSASNPAAPAARLISFGSGASVQFTGTPNSGQSLTINGQGYTLLYSMSDVQNINNNLTGRYALAVPLDASGVSNWAPVGTGAGVILNSTGFTGAFQGLGNTISNLTINSPFDYVGLFGFVGPGGLIQNIGVVSGSITGESAVGGLIGFNIGTVTNAYATAAVTGSSGSSGGVGGLIGINGGTVTQSYATGTVTVSNGGDIDAGGLVGDNEGAISLSHATGTVTGGEFNIGGLVGGNGGSVTQSYASATVSGTSNAIAGGLVGYNFSVGHVTDSYATGTVSAGNGIGGLAGVNDGVITQSYALGAVNFTGNSNTGFGAGGLVGFNDGTLTRSYATGAVTATASGNLVGTGGLVGVNASPGTITESYATGTVDGVGNVGGLIGYNNAHVTQTYATGAVTGTTPSTTGELVGLNDANGTVATSYWDTTTGLTNGYGTNNNSGGFSGQGLTTAQFGTATNFAGWKFGTTPGGSTGCTDGGFCWVIVDADGTLNNANNAAGATRPMLLSEYSTTITNPHQLQLMALDLSANYTLAKSINLGPSLSSASDVWGQNGGGGFVPIGNSSTPFNGFFNGSGNTISNLTIDFPISSDVGLFGFVGYNGIIRNVGLVGGSVTGNFFVGGLAGENEGTVTDSYATITVSGSNYVGGLIGANELGGTAVNTYATGPVSGSNYVGGLIGINDNDSKVSNAFATGTVTASNSTDQQVGGLIGHNGGTVTATYATGAVVSSGRDVGGLIGQNSGTVSLSYWDIQTSGIGVHDGVGNVTDATGVTGLTTAQLQSGLPSGFDATVWGSNSNINNSFPFLLWQLPAGYQVVAGHVFNDAGITSAGGGISVSGLVNGTSVGSETTGANGSYNIILAPGTISAAGSQVLTYTTGDHAGAAYIQNATGSVENLNIYIGYLNETSGAANLSTISSGLSTAIGSHGSVGSLVANLSNRSINAIGASFAIDQSINAGTLLLSSTGTVTQSAPITATSLALSGSGGSFMLTNSANQIGTLAANAGSIDLIDSTNLSIGTVAGTNGVTAATLSLTDTGAVSQSEPISVTNLALLGSGGSFTLTNSGNQIGTLAANTGNVSLTNETNLSIGTVGGTSGVTAITLALSDTGAVSQTEPISVTNLALVGGGGFTLNNSANQIGTLTASTGSVSLTDSTNLNVLGVVGTGTGNTLILTDSETVTQTGPILVTNLALLGGGSYTLTNSANRIGTLAANAGSIDLIDSTNLSIGTVAGTNGVTAATLSLTDTGAVSQSEPIAVTNLALLGSGGSFSLTNSANQIGTLAANTGSVNLTDSTNLSIGTVGGTSGVTAITLALTDTGAVSQNESLSVTNLALLGGSGSFTLTNFGNQVGTLAANAGNISLTDATNLNIGSLSGTSGVTASGGLTLDVSGGIAATEAVNVGTFTLAKGNWSQVDASLPGFSAQNFVISGGSFLRASAGDGSSGNPYQITDVYGLQGIGSSSTLLTKSYLLANTIDASSTANWNGGAGFVPIGGNSSASFTGTLNGNGNTISGLTINASSQTVVGLFGFVGSGGTVENVGLAGGLVSGGLTMGDLIGLNGGTVTNSYATGVVNGGASAESIGGLVGTNEGLITGSYATGAVNGGDFAIAGGLAGSNFGTISQSHATGNVTTGATGIAGGLVGINLDTVSNNSVVVASITGSYATGNVSAGNGSETSTTSAAGGLVGDNFGTVTQSYAIGAVTVGANGTAGGLVGQNGLGITGGQFGTASISSSYATGPVSSSGINVQLGGLVGQNDPGAQITNSQAYGKVTSTASLSPSDNNCSLSGTCIYVDVGGFVGANYGTITGTAWTAAPTSCAASFSCASGNVSVGSLGSGGGFVGYNEGIISYAFATGAVTGAAGLPDTVTSDNLFNNTTSIAGFVADNRGQISHSFATGDVGTAGTMWLSAGGFAGENKGTIDSSFATGAVMTGDNSTAGGFANGNGPDSNTQTCPSCFVGDGLNNSAAISNSQAFGNVTVGASSVAGGFSAGGGGDKGQSGGSFTNVTASGSVNAGHDSVVGGLVGVLFEGGSIASSSAQNPLVASSGPNSIIGGIVGLNLGSISDTTSTAPVSGASDSYIGGITGINLGVVTGSSTDPDITGTGGNNIIGGIAGLNAGSIDNSTALIALSSGSGSDTGGVAGVNGSYSNTTATIVGSSFPNGTITNSSATGTGFGSQTGTAAPASPPELPSWLTGCSGSAVCTILIGGSLQSGSGGSPTPPSGPTNTPPPPTEPTITPNSPPTLIPTDTLANQQVLQFTQPVSFTPTNVAPPLVDPATLTSLNGSTPGNAGNAPGGGGANGLNGNSTNGNTGTLANGRQGGNGAPPGVRLIDMPVLPLPPGSGVPPIGETRFLIDEVVLQFGPEVTPQQVADFARRLRLTIVSQYTIAALHRTVYTFRITRGQSVAEVIRQAERAGLHVAAQPNYTYQFTQDQGGSAAADPGDPAQYIVQKLQLGAVHRITEGKDVVVAVIDSQVDTKQPDFAGRIVESYDAGCGPNTPPDAHGTGMTGAIASHIGLLGVAPNARIIAICAFGGTGKPEATSAKIIRGVDYAIAHGAKIINMSFAGPRDPALAQELQIAREKGILIIAAAGNAGPKSPPLYPGADPNVMAVTATDEHDRLFIGANQGTYVAVAAPGVNILVPAPNGDVQFTTGTSVASANVSGVAALLMAEKARTPEEIRAILVDTAKHLGANGMNSQFGAGLVDPLKALRFVPPAIGRSSSAAPPVKLH